MTTLATPAALESMVRHLLLLDSLGVVFLAVYLVLVSLRLGVVLLRAKFLTLPLMILSFALEHYGNGIIFQLRSGQTSSIRN
ncbi:Kazal-like serine protease inhibitor domain and phox-like domain-containing protein [Phytophthora cinnamomi]|uniref:Kazal-like serine protease inhibitor domain and phox-like domain-containing protein n=1 Tax=Phytophthora cinnamomi TaxID=4785 RepID=UPI003559DC15|nr:Kazal-like serine protease inhibitor domain and phox-like domain-containing protein [Phytophthora cinnamomi]